VTVPPSTSTVIVATNGSPAGRRAVERAAELLPSSDVVVAMVVRGGRAGPVATDNAAVGAATHDLAVDAARDVLLGACDAVGSRAQAVCSPGKAVLRCAPSPVPRGPAPSSPGHSGPALSAPLRYAPRDAASCRLSRLLVGSSVPT
jgi:hypothetical protein